jgi:hypothetical protein
VPEFIIVAEDPIVPVFVSKFELVNVPVLEKRFLFCTVPLFRIVFVESIEPVFIKILELFIVPVL